MTGTFFIEADAYFVLSLLPSPSVRAISASLGNSAYCPFNLDLIRSVYQYRSIVSDELLQPTFNIYRYLLKSFTYHFEWKTYPSQH